MFALIPYYPVPVIQIPLPGGSVLPIHGFGLLVALGFLIGGNVAAKRAARAGLDGAAIDKVVGWLVVGTFVGGHVGYGLMYDFGNYMANPVEFLKVWQGLSSMGGFVVCVPLAFWFFHKNKLPMLPYMDSLAIGMGVGWFLGRMGCTVAHDHPGTPSTAALAKYCRPVEGHTLDMPSWLYLEGKELRWGPCRDLAEPAVTALTDTVPVDYAGVVGAHDMGFYEALWSLGVFLLFLLLDRKAHKPGFFISLIGVLYAPVRFYMDFLRPETTDGRWFLGTPIEMTPGQFWSIVLGVVAMWGLIRSFRSDAKPYGPSQPATPEEGGRMAASGE